MLIVLDGADGCGKDTIAERVANLLGCKKMSFPNDAGYTGPMIRQYLRREWYVVGPSDNTKDPTLWQRKDMSALAFQCLQLANRMEVYETLQYAADDYNDLVLARYNPSTMVYGQLDGLDPTWIKATCEALPRADFNILLDVPAEVSMERRAKRDGALSPERYEGKLDMTKKIVGLYRDLWWTNQHQPGWYVADASQPIDGVMEQVVGLLRKYGLAV